MASGYQAPTGPVPPAKKTNVLAIVSLCCAIAGLLVLPFTLVILVPVIFSLPLSIAGIACGVLGKQKVDRGELPELRGLAQAGFVVGIVGVALHVLAALAYLVIVLLVVGGAGDAGPLDPERRRDLDGARSQLSVALRI